MIWLVKRILISLLGEREDRLMVFDSSYDKSLYLILKNNKRNKEQLIDFFKLIPYEFYEKIRNSIIDFKEYINNDKIRRYFNSEIYTNDGYLYSFNIDINSGVLSIIRSVYQYGAYYKEMEVRLCNNDNIDNYVRRNIGTVCYGFNNNIDVYRNNYFSRLKEYNYDIINISYKNILLLFGNDRFLGIERLDMNNIDNDLCDNIINNNKKRCLRKDKYDI